MTMTLEQSLSGDLAALLPKASVEISSRGHQLDELHEHFSPDIDVSITFLPGDHYQHNVETAAALRRAGFNPVPHIAAREITSREALDDFFRRLRGEADVHRILLIAGDLAIAKGPFKSSRDVAASGLIEAHGFSRVSVAGHPEGHPYLDTAQTMKSLAASRDWGRERQVAVDIVTQFCFEVAPILNWLGELRIAAIDLPVVIGFAGPASPATLMKFALRCGVGNSIRAVRNKIGRYGRLLTETGPDEVVRGLEAAPKSATSQIIGFHLFPFGGLRKSARWLNEHASVPGALQNR
ncbi:methylenetetrahydrofolate reductase [Bradyrhizobium sp. Ec3.3]|uniref:methylenetetrahydrofolate reductase n=1 Tax=Bradyrhizobium sp. Ec3.3 TaxID=189753 RepID=UPI00041577E9|nr:methylenetetrahydrofolate reductase [Bradyrhizobium sp. Ec3.3]